MLHGLHHITLLRPLKACPLPHKCCRAKSHTAYQMPYRSLYPATKSFVTRKHDLLVVWAADGITLGLAERAGMFRLAQYGPINSLSIRKNEVILTVQL